MKKKIMMTALVGALAGVALSTLITLGISLMHNNGQYYPVVPELILLCKTEVSAMLVQTICSLIYGAIWALASLIWTIENWSLLKQTLVHLTVCSFGTLPIAYCLWWMPHSLPGIGFYFSLFFLIYALIWFWQFATMKRKIRQLNQQLNTRGNTNQKEL